MMPFLPISNNILLHEEIFAGGRSRIDLFLTPHPDLLTGSCIVPYVLDEGAALFRCPDRSVSSCVATIAVSLMLADAPCSI